MTATLATDAQVIAAAEALPWIVLKDLRGIPMVIQPKALRMTDIIVARFADFEMARDFCDTIPLPVLKAQCRCVGFCHCK